MGSGFHKLPRELFDMTMNQMDSKSLGRLSRASWEFNHALKDRMEDTVWEDALPPDDYYDAIFVSNAAGRIVAVNDWRRLPNTPQYMADSVKRGNADAVKGYLDVGVSANSFTLQGERMLCLAAGLGHAETVKLLLDYGANCELTDINSGGPWVSGTTVFPRWSTPVYHASQWVEQGGSADVLHLLFNAGAKIKTFQELLSITQSPDCTKILDHAMNRGSDIFSLRGLEGETILYHVVHDKRLVKYFVTKMPTLMHVKDDHDQTVLHALIEDDTIEETETAIYLVKRGSNLGTELDDSILHRAIAKGYIDIVREILKRRDIDVNLGAVRNMPTRFALYEKQFEILILLLEDHRTEVDTHLLRDARGMYRSKGRYPSTQEDEPELARAIQILKSEFSGHQQSRYF